MSDAVQILASAKSILLVDWSSPTIPRKLIERGFMVYCASPGRYSVVELVSTVPEGIDPTDIIAPQPGETGYLVFRRLNDSPSHVDIVNVYRPENEHALIVANHVLGLNAKVLWLQPSITSNEAAQLAIHHGFELIEGVDIATAVEKLGIKT